MIKRIFITLLAVGLMAPLTACSTAKKGASSVPADTSVTTPEASKALRIWGNQADTALQAAIADFETNNPDVSLTIETPKSDTFDYFKSQVNTGAEPDIVMLDHMYITAMGRQGILKDLTQYGANDIAGKYIPSTWSAVTYKGHVYGLPQNGNTIALMYNKDMLDAAGKQPPVNYDQLMAVGQELSKQKGKTAFTAPFFDMADEGRKNWAAFEYFFWLWREGGDILNGDLTAPLFNQQPGVDALNDLKKLVDNGVCNGSKYMESDFYSGKVGMIEMGCWALPTIEDSRSANFGVALLPQLKPGVPGYSGLGLFAMGVTDKCQYPQEAYDFLAAYTTTVDYQLEYCEKNNALPVIEEALDSDFYSTDNWQTFIAQYKLSKARPGVACWDKVEAAIADAVANTIQHGNAQAELDKAATTVQGLLDQENAGDV